MPCRRSWPAVCNMFPPQPKGLTGRCMTKVQPTYACRSSVVLVTLLWGRAHLLCFWLSRLQVLTFTFILLVFPQFLENAWSMILCKIMMFYNSLEMSRQKARIYFSFRKKREANLSSSVYMALCFQVLPMRIYIIYAMSIYGLVSSPCGFSVFGENFLG